MYSYVCAGACRRPSTASGLLGWEGVDADPRRAPGWNMVGRKEVIARQMVATALNAKLAGYNVDWETGSNNSVACFVDLWSHVGAALRKHGLQLNTDIDQSCLKLPGFPGPYCGPTQWSYLWNFDSMIAAFDSFSEMATVSHCGSS